MSHLITVKWASGKVQAHSMWVLNGPGGWLDNAAEKESKVQSWDAIHKLRHLGVFPLCLRSPVFCFPGKCDTSRRASSWRREVNGTWPLSSESLASQRIGRNPVTHEKLTINSTFLSPHSQSLFCVLSTKENNDLESVRGRKHSDELTCDTGVESHLSHYQLWMAWQHPGLQMPRWDAG